MKKAQHHLTLQDLTKMSLLCCIKPTQKVIHPEIKTVYHVQIVVSKHDLVYPWSSILYLHFDKCFQVNPREA